AEKGVEEAVDALELLRIAGVREVAGKQQEVGRPQALRHVADAFLQHLLHLPPEILAPAAQVQVRQVQPADRSWSGHAPPPTCSCCSEDTRKVSEVLKCYSRNMAGREGYVAAPPRVETRGYQWLSLRDREPWPIRGGPLRPTGTAILSPGFQPGVRAR